MKGERKTEASRFADAVGHRVRAVRLARGMTCQDVADMAGVGRSSLAKWETGGGAGTLLMAARVAVALGVSLDELVSDQPIRVVVEVPGVDLSPPA
jgi:transcriptional regulator with XRE-family HTH domain